jgi:hypothetical protein
VLERLTRFFSRTPAEDRPDRGLNSLRVPGAQRGAEGSAKLLNSGFTLNHMIPPLGERPAASLEHFSKYWLQSADGRWEATKDAWPETPWGQGKGALAKWIASGGTGFLDDLPEGVAAGRAPDFRLETNGRLGKAFGYQTRAGLKIAVAHPDGPWVLVEGTDGNWHSALDMARQPEKVRRTVPELKPVLDAVAFAYNSGYKKEHREALFKAIGEV